MTEKGKPLPNDAIVYRAILHRTWIDNGKLLPVAFFRIPEKDQDGVSVSQSATNLLKLLKRIRKLARVNVAEIRFTHKLDGSSLDLDVISDPIPELDPLHALITGLPYYYGNDVLASMEAAAAIIASPSLSIIDVSMSAVAA